MNVRPCILPNIVGFILRRQDSMPRWLDSIPTGLDDIPRGSSSNLEDQVPSLERETWTGRPNSMPKRLRVFR